MRTRTDWLLLFLGADGGPYPADQVRIMKGLFLLAADGRHPASIFYRFEPYDYGPFDSRVYRDLDALQLEGLIDVQRSPGSSRKTYHLTEEGRRRYRVLCDLVSPSDLAAVRVAKTRVTSLSFDELLSAIYIEHPAFATNSVARVAQRMS